MSHHLAAQIVAHFLQDPYPLPFPFDLDRIDATVRILARLPQFPRVDLETFIDDAMDQYLACRAYRALAS